MSVGKLIRKGLPFSNVVASGTATAQVTPGRTIETLRLKLGGTSFTKSMISLVKLKANGKTIVEGTGTELDAMQAYRGVSTNASFLDLDFADFAMNNEFDRHVGSFDTSTGIVNITSEITIAGATAPTLEQILFEAAQQKDASGASAAYAPLLTKVLRYPFTQASAGRQVFTVPFGATNGAIIKRLHVRHSGNMTGATVKQDGLVIHESLAAENNFAAVKHGRVPQTNTYTIDFCLDGDIRKALNTKDARSLEWLFDFSASDTGYVLVEYLDPLGNL